MLNTKTLAQLEDAQNIIIQKFNLTLCRGIKNGNVSLEDGLPWLEVEGKINKAISKNFAQELADSMNILILYNRLDIENSESCLHLVMDFAPEAATLGENEAIPANSDDADAKEFMLDYGKEFFPKNFKKPK